MMKFEWVKNVSIQMPDRFKNVIFHMGFFKYPQNVSPLMGKYEVKRMGPIYVSWWYDSDMPKSISLK